MKVSVCVPTYNDHAKFLSCFNSIMDQVCCDYEIVVSDDSTNLESSQIIENICKTKNVLYHHNETPLGPAGNWNKSISLASGDLIKIMHHDDKFKDNKCLKRFVKYMEKNKDTIIAFSNSILVSQGNVVGHTKISEKIIKKINASPGLLFSKNFLGAPSACIFRKLDNVDFDSRFQWLIDLVFYYQIRKYGKIGHIDADLIVVDNTPDGRLTTTVENDGKINLQEHSMMFSIIDKGHINLTVIYRYAIILIKFRTALIRCAMRRLLKWLE
jgi:glycosyltransferase involved in cell wall biosynthesis